MVSDGTRCKSDEQTLVLWRGCLDRCSSVPGFRGLRIVSLAVERSICRWDRNCGCWFRVVHGCPGSAGRVFQRPRAAKRPVTTGLNSKFRHPIYLFGEAAFVGLFIAWGKLIGFLYLDLFSPVQISRIRKEETVLEQALGKNTADTKPARGSRTVFFWK